MSKKSRRRNKKILGALGALGALALMGRRRDASIETNEAKEAGFDIPAVKSKKPKKVKTSKTIMDNKPKKFVPRLKVTDRGNVIRDGKDTGVGNEKTNFVGGDGKIFRGGVQVGESGVTTPGISVRDDGSIMAKGVLYPNRNAYRNRRKLPANLTSDMGMDREGVTIPEENFKTSDFDYFGSFARGGRVKKKPFAKRGFGRAYKKGRK